MHVGFDAVELTYVSVLFGGFLLLWRIKRMMRRRDFSRSSTGCERHTSSSAPDRPVLHDACSP